ncbi:MAG: ribosome silencing factor [Candidatus Hydrogenedentales bacterium]
MAELVGKPRPQDDDYLPNALRIADVLEAHRAKNIVAYDVQGLTTIADCFVIASATSEPHFKALLNAVRKEMKEVGVRARNIEGEVTGGWIILDYGAVMVHIFREEAREFYDLDGLWGDAKQIALDLDGDAASAR